MHFSSNDQDSINASVEFVNQLLPLAIPQINSVASVETVCVYVLVYVSVREGGSYKEGRGGVINQNSQLIQFIGCFKMDGTRSLLESCCSGGTWCECDPNFRAVIFTEAIERIADLI